MKWGRHIEERRKSFTGPQRGTHTHTHVYTHIHIHIHIHMHTQRGKHTHTHTHAYTKSEHTHSHTYTYTKGHILKHIVERRKSFTGLRRKRRKPHRQQREVIEDIEWDEGLRGNT